MPKHMKLRKTPIIPMLIENGFRAFPKNGHLYLENQIQIELRGFGYYYVERPNPFELYPEFEANGQEFRQFDMRNIEVAFKDNPLNYYFFSPEFNVAAFEGFTRVRFINEFEPISTFTMTGKFLRLCKKFKMDGILSSDGVYTRWETDEGRICITEKVRIGGVPPLQLMLNHGPIANINGVNDCLTFWNKTVDGIVRIKNNEIVDGPYKNTPYLGPDVTILAKDREHIKQSRLVYVEANGRLVMYQTDGSILVSKGATE